MSFKDSFVWGAAAAAYQIEGAAFEDGKGLNIWDTFSHISGKVFDGHTGDVACDHYHRLNEDLDAMSAMSLKSYRFSVSWARLMPEGTGAINQSAVSFYNKLIDGLLKRNITPCMTLYHWDLPYALHLKGGWLNDDSPKWFAEYAKTIKALFGDRVHDFITFNEPQVFVGCGYYEGVHAPGYKLSKPELIRIGHNVLKAHGLAVLALRNGSKCRIGLTGASRPAMPTSLKEEDIEIARNAYFNSDYAAFAFSDAFWFDPAILGKYPEWVMKESGINMPKITPEDMHIIQQPLDFIGLNIYCGRYASKEADNLTYPTGFARTSIKWPVTPEALYWGPKFFFERYGTPIVITENGMACHDAISLDGKVHDPNRIDYMQRYLKELKRASEDGVDIDGYYAWSLMDNFEWAEGYNERFGLIHIDYATQVRTFKDSAYFYKSLIEANGENL